MQEVRAAAARPGAARTLLLDVDGTLAPLAPTPEEASVPAATLGTLRRLSEQGWTLVAVSGRPAREIRRMLPLGGLLVFGSHGAERPAGLPGAAAMPSAGTLARLDRLHAGLQELAADHPGVRLELKPAGLAIHDRALASAGEREWRAALREWLAARDIGDLEILEGKRVVELRPRGVDKGAAVAAIAAHLGLAAEDGSFLALGDDVTDEDMFREMRGRGLAVRVGESGAPTGAARRLASIEDAAEFLRRLAG